MTENIAGLSWIAVDLSADGADVRRLPASPSCRLAALPGAKQSAGRKDSRRPLSGWWESFSLQFEKEVLDRETDLRHSIVVLGIDNDPFHPFDDRFSPALRILEYLACLQPALLCVQTRSPLIVLALPVLKGLGRRAQVVMYFEGPDSPAGTPPIIERAKAARILAKAGIAVVIHVSPESGRKGLGTYAKLCSRLSLPLFIEHEHFAPAGERLKQYLRTLGAEPQTGVLEQYLSRAAESGDPQAEAA